MSEDKLKIVEQHIAKFERWAPNEAMLERLRNALDRNQEIAGADLSFYYHELFEAQRTSLLMPACMRSEEAQPIAHNQAIAEYGVSRYSIYHPEVIEAFPDEFNKNWRNAWGIHR